MGRADIAAVKQTRRSGRERGCWLYIAAEQLEAMGIDPTDPAPQYRVWATEGRPRAVVSLYPRKEEEPGANSAPTSP